MYKIFDDRYVDVGDRMEKYLRSIQALDISDLCNMYLKKDYNALINSVKKGGYEIRAIEDKKKLHDLMENIICDGELSIIQAIEYAIENKMLKRTETLVNILEYNKNFLKQLEEDSEYQKFKQLYEEGKNTFNRILNDIRFVSEEEFKETEKVLKREKFLKSIFSKEIKFGELLAYSKYLNEETEYVTMHKTKGTSINSVIVVMEEYFWTEYDFSLIYKRDDNKMKKAEASQRLIYVACSRAKKELICIKLLTEIEKPYFLNKFPQAKFVEL